MKELITMIVLGFIIAFALMAMMMSYFGKNDDDEDDSGYMHWI
jgi:hypothetical protein